MVSPRRALAFGFSPFGKLRPVTWRNSSLRSICGAGEIVCQRLRWQREKNGKRRRRRGREGGGGELNERGRRPESCGADSEGSRQELGLRRTSRTPRNYRSNIERDKNQRKERDGSVNEGRKEKEGKAQAHSSSSSKDSDSCSKLTGWEPGNLYESDRISKGLMRVREANLRFSPPCRQMTQLCDLVHQPACRFRRSKRPWNLRDLGSEHPSER